MGKNYKMSQSRFFCTQCGKEGIPVQRKQGQMREAGHLKKLYCLFCGVETNHAEVREIGGYTYEDFQEEFNMGRFKEDGTREKIDELWGCSNTTCPFNRNGKCWNANNSADCKYKPKVDNG